MAAVTLIDHAGTLVLGPADGPHPGRAGPPARIDAVLDIVTDGAVAIVDGEVAVAGDRAAVTAEYPPNEADRTVDAGGGVVLPGFIDAHTHAVFAGDRADEFAAKLRGKSYQEIMAAGGGIPRTVQAVRRTSEDALADRLRGHLDAMLAHGSTTVEVKSGYGLDVETELKLLAAIDRAANTHPVRLVPTFLGAHATPEGTTADAYIDRVIDDQIPAVAEQGVARFCDVFCEEGVFDVPQSRRVLEAGRNHGLTPKLHADEFARIGASRLAANLSATSADHLLQSTRNDADALAAADVTPTFLPATALALDTDYADPRPFLAAGCEIALATDFNPNCYAPGLPFTITLGCAGMRLTPAAAIRATTAGAAAALETDPERPPAIPSDLGTLTPGAPGDAVILDVPSLDHIPYRFGENRVRTVLIGGEVVHRFAPPG